MIGAELFGRSIDYDTGSDSVVRVMATEVRKRLKQFYLESSQDGSPVSFELPSGTYVPVFVFEDFSLEEPVEPIEPIGRVHEEVQTAEPAAEPDPAAQDEAVTSAPAPAVANPLLSAKKRALSLWIVAVLLAGALLSEGLYKLWTSVIHRGQQIRSVVVVPLKNLSRDPKEDFFADGITAELINNLGQTANLRVISLTSSMNLKGSTKMIPEIARELNVEGVIEGSVQREGDRVRINIELVNGREDRPVWAQTYLRDANSILNLQGEIASDIAKKVTAPDSAREQSRPVLKQFVSPEAHAAYLHGLLLLQAEQDEEAFSYLKQAVQAAPQFAEAHSALAECMGRMAVSGLKPNREAFAAQKAEALQAISLDASLAEAHAELADSVMALDWDWQTAAAEYQRALELNPNSAEIHQKYAIFRTFQGQTAEAIRQVEIGADLDPTSAIAVRNQVFVYFFARKYDKVLSLIDTARSVGMDPPGSSYFLGATHAEMGQYDTSRDWFLKAAKSPHTLGHLGALYAVAGQKRDALKSLATLKSDVQDHGIGQYEVALVYTALGDKKSAIEWLRRASDAHDIGLLYIRIDPFLDPLRSDPEFQKLVKQIGLPV